MSLTKNIPMYSAKYVYKQDLWFNVFNNLPFLSKSFPSYVCSTIWISMWKKNRITVYHPFYSFSSNHTYRHNTLDNIRRQYLCVPNEF